MLLLPFKLTRIGEAGGEGLGVVGEVGDDGLEVGEGTTCSPLLLLELVRDDDVGSLKLGVEDVEIGEEGTTWSNILPLLLLELDDVFGSVRLSELADDLEDVGLVVGVDLELEEGTDLLPLLLPVR